MNRIMWDDEGEPLVVRSDGVSMLYSDARRAFEAGEFSDWSKDYFPLVIQGVEYADWEHVEDALSIETWDKTGGEPNE